MIFWTATFIIFVIAIPYYCMAFINIIIKVGKYNWEMKDVLYALNNLLINKDISLEEIRRLRCNELNIKR